MRVAMFSPMPPSKSGIADYSAALAEPLSKIVDLKINSDETGGIGLYQIGNNGYHGFVYEQALAKPGVVVLHESNLHHLIAEITIKRGDWDGYLAAVEAEGGATALQFAQRVKALEIGPDYDGLPMLRRLLSRARGAIVHSHFVEADVRAAGYGGPVAVIPHGAWIPEADRMGARDRLGLDPAVPLIGVFGFLKPYKRIAESLRVFKRLLRLHPTAKMILAGEPHRDFPLQAMIDRLGLGPSVRVLGFVPIEDFVGYIAATDIVLNLRYPTVGESSGTLLRSLGLGRAVIVSNIGSFAEYPDSICMKVPVDDAEEDTLFEYLDLLISRPDLRASLGGRARQWVELECNWHLVAERYAEFLECVEEGKPFTNRASSAQPAPEPEAVNVEPEYIIGWGANEAARDYVRGHITRLERTLAITPPGQRVLEMGAYLQITPALQTKLGYKEVRGCYFGKAGEVERREVTSVDGERFVCDVDLFDAERDRFPYEDEHFDTVLCCELIEHLPSDPMFMMAEINRILRPGGHLVLTTPNSISLRAVSAILQGYHPGFFPAYIKPGDEGDEPEARHAREYAPREVAQIFRDAGFEVTLLETGEFLDEPHPEQAWVRQMLEQYQLDGNLRGDGIYAVGVKRGVVRERYPVWLYS